jgi:hypothetical protein
MFVPSAEPNANAKPAIIARILNDQTVSYRITESGASRRPCSPRDVRSESSAGRKARLIGRVSNSERRVRGLAPMCGRA